jgi:hypothetical protein
VNVPTPPASSSAGPAALDLDNASTVGRLAPCVLWRDVNGRKVPVDGAGRAVNPLDPENQMPFDDAAQVYAGSCKQITGIGIVLTGTPRDDGLVLTVLDYDAKGNIAAEERMRRNQIADAHTALFNSYTEVSVSGLGRHIITWARPTDRNLRLGEHGEIEVFQNKRFIALTGHLMGGTAEVEARADELNKVLAEHNGSRRVPLRVVAGLDFSPSNFGPLAQCFRDLPVENDLGAGINDAELPPRDEVARWCDAIMNSAAALTKVGEYDTWVRTLGFPLARLANHQPQDDHFYRGRFLAVSAAAPKFDEPDAEAKWDELRRAAAQYRDGANSWRSLRHFAYQHGYVDPPTAGGSGYPAGNSDPLRFTCLPLNEAVARINTEFFVLRSGKIYRQGDDGELTAVPKHDFKTALGGRWVKLGDKRRSAADAWLNAPKRREYRGLQYCPNGVGLKPYYLNLWKGWGDVSPAQGDCSTITDHILQVLADGDQAKSDFLLNWMADILQNPTRKPGVSVVLRGRQGSGKTVLAMIARKLLGHRNVLTVNDKERMLGKFNSSVMNKILLVGEEMLFAGDRATTDKLKHLITGNTLPIEFKFGDALEIESYHRLLLTSNHEQVFQAAGEERRFVIYDVSDAKRGDAEHFDKLYAITDGRDDATAAAFMKFLLDRDLTAFQPWKAQQCFAADTALMQQKSLSFSPPLQWLREVVENVVGQGPSGDYDWNDGVPYPRRQGSAWPPQPRESKWPPRFPRRQAVDAFRDWATKAKPFGAAEYTGSQGRFWAEICKVIPLGQTNRQTTGGVRTVVIDLTDLQNNFEKYLRGQAI